MCHGTKPGDRSLGPCWLFQRFCFYPNLVFRKTIKDLSRRVTLNFYKIILAIVQTRNYKGIKVDRRLIRRLLEKR